MEARDWYLEFPEIWDEIEWDIQEKGWNGAVRLHLSNRVIRLTFYDPSRIAADANHLFAHGHAALVMPCIIVVPSVTRPNIEAAVQEIASMG